MRNAATITPCPYSGQWDGYQSLSTFLQKTARSHLPLHATACYVYPAPYKTGVGIRTPKLTKATPDAVSVFFCVRHIRHSMAWRVLFNADYPPVITHNGTHHAAHNGAVRGYRAGLAPSIGTHNRTPCRPVMVTLAGQPQGWPVPFVPGSSNPVNVTAPIEIRTSSGDSLTRTKEAA
ncbi:TPA: ash family protein [Salmonella enterica subsp. diarizonae serovar 61:r:-]